MEEKHYVKISLSTFLLIISIIVILVMEYFLYKFYNDSNVYEGKITSLNNQISALENHKSQVKDEEINATESEVRKSSEPENIKDKKNESTQKLNDVFDMIRNDKTEGMEKQFYMTKDQIIENYSIENEYGDEYALIDINNDGIDDLLYYDLKSETSFELYVWKGTSKGFEGSFNPVNGHVSHTSIKKEKEKPYLTISYEHMGNENISHFYFIDNGYAYKEVYIAENTEKYVSEGLQDTIKWVKVPKN